MKVIVLGAGGMLGHKMFQVMERVFPGKVLGTIRTIKSKFIENNTDKMLVLNADFKEELEKTFEIHHPEFVLNCIGSIPQKNPEKESYKKLNAVLPVTLNILSEKYGYKLIHFSSDCVFTGSLGKYTEEDTPDADSIYGKSKAVGEFCSSNNLVLRTSIIGRELYGNYGLLEWFLSQKEVKGYTNHFYSGVTTLELALIVKDIILYHNNLKGLYNISAEPVSKYNLLCLIKNTLNLDIKIIPFSTEVSVDRTLNANKFNYETGYVSPIWSLLLKDLLIKDLTPYDLWR